MNPTRLFTIPALVVLALATIACRSVQPATSADMDRLGERIVRSIGEARPASAQTPVFFPSTPTGPVTYTRAISSHSDKLGIEGGKEIDLTTNAGGTLTITVTGAPASGFDLGQVISADPALQGGVVTPVDRLRARYTEPKPATAVQYGPPPPMPPAPAGWHYNGSGGISPNCR